MPAILTDLRCLTGHIQRLLERAKGAWFLFRNSHFSHDLWLRRAHYAWLGLQSGVFQYDDLDYSQPSLRLVRVVKMVPSEPIVCELSMRSIPTEYTALSYCWGSEEDPELIELQSVDTGHQGYVLVRRNLHTFLRYVIEHGESHTWFWVDAVCLNQFNIQEKNHQVKHMGAIYSHAQRTVIWLGVDQVNHDLVNATAEAILGRQISNRDFAFALDLRRVEQLFHRQRHHLSLETAVARLRDHEYWTRMWIIQEVCLASTSSLKLWLQNLSVSWEDFVYIYRVLESLAQDEKISPNRRPFAQLRIRSADMLPASALRNLIQMSKDRQPGPKKPAMSHYLRSFRASQCSNVHDRIYGLLALVDRGGDFPIDYSRDTLQLFHLVRAHFDFHGSEARTEWLVEALGLKVEQVMKRPDLFPRSAAYRTQSPFSPTENFVYDLEDNLAVLIDRKPYQREPSGGTICAACGAEFDRCEEYGGKQNPTVWCTDLSTIRHFHFIFQPAAQQEDALQLTAIYVSTMYRYRGHRLPLPPKPYLQAFLSEWSDHGIYYCSSILINQQALSNLWESGRSSVNHDIRQARQDLSLFVLSRLQRSASTANRDISRQKLLMKPVPEAWVFGANPQIGLYPDSTDEEMAMLHHQNGSSRGSSAIEWMLDDFETKFHGT